MKLRNTTEQDKPRTPRRSRKICDYSGHACHCDGYRPIGVNTKGMLKTWCVCGHSKSQHH